MMANRGPWTFAIIGAAMTVHRTLGHGFLEAVYQEALEHELVACGIPYHREFPLPIHYRGKILQTSYRVDFLCHGSILSRTQGPPKTLWYRGSTSHPLPESIQFRKSAADQLRCPITGI